MGTIPSTNSNQADDLGGLDDEEGAGCRLSENEEPTLLEHKGVVLSVAMSSVAKILVAGCDDKEMVVWDTTSKTRRWQANLGAAVHVVACTSSGANAACASSDNNVVVWHISPQKMLWTRSMDSAIISLVFHPFTDALAIGEASGKVTIAHACSSRTLLSVEHHAAARSMSFSPDGNLLAIGGSRADDQGGLGYPTRASSKKGTDSRRYSSGKVPGISLFEIELSTATSSRDVVQTSNKENLVEHIDSNSRVVAFSPCGKWRAVGVFQGRSRISLLSCPDSFKELAELYCSPGVTTISWLPNSEALFCAGEDRQLNFWCISSPLSEQLVPQQPPVTGSYRSVVCVPRTNFIASCTDGDRFVRLNKLVVEERSSLEPISKGRMTSKRMSDPTAVSKELREEARRSSIPWHAKAKVTIGSTEVVKIRPEQDPEGHLVKPDADRNPRQLKHRGTIKFGLKGRDSAIDLSIPHDTRSFLRRPSRVGLGDGGLRIKIEKVEAAEGTCKHLCQCTGRWYDLSTLMGLSGASKGISRPNKRKAVALQHDDEVSAVAFSSDGSTLLAGGHDNLVVLWHVASGLRLMEAKVGSPVTAVALSPSGHYAVAAEERSLAHVWKIEGSIEEIGQVCVEGQVMSVAHCGTPNVIAVGGTAKKVWLFGLPDFHHIAELMHDGDVRCLRFSPDGRFLAGGGGTDMYFGLMTKKAGHDAPTMKTVIWNVSEDPDKCGFVGCIECNDVVHTVAFSPDGGILAVAGENAQISLFSAEL
jgi:WD40 repeat protein